MKNEVGTLQEIGAQVGDSVENIDFENEVYYVQGSNDPYGRGVLWASTEKVHTKGDLWNSREYGWRIISRANQGPVSEVTTVRKVIEPGVYGAVEVGNWSGPDNMVCLGIMQDWSTGSGKEKGLAVMSRAELTSAIDTLTVIRDAMSDCSGDVSTAQAG